MSQLHCGTLTPFGPGGPQSWPIPRREGGVHSIWTEDQVLPLIGHAIDCFGADRVLFGGDWPVIELSASYGQWVDIVGRATQHLSHADRRTIFRENAIKTYRFDRPS
ncbi:amidohydrolase family protein [Caballeronia grimmiae]